MFSGEGTFRGERERQTYGIDRESAGIDHDGASPIHSLATNWRTSLPANMSLTQTVWISRSLSIAPWYSWSARVGGWEVR